MANSRWLFQEVWLWLERWEIFTEENGQGVCYNASGEVPQKTSDEHVSCARELKNFANVFYELNESVFFLDAVSYSLLLFCLSIGFVFSLLLFFSFGCFETYAQRYVL